MEYNIGFTLGDPSGDGHACTTDYHMVTNHSVDEISEAYKKTTELLGFDFIKKIGAEFQSDHWIPKEFTEKLLKLGMSYTELHAGTLTKINTKGLTVEEYCEFLCKKYGYEIAYEGDTYAETLMDVDDTYKVLNGELYKCDDTQYLEGTSYLVDVRSNGDGTYEYIAQFYNGSTWLNEVLEEGLNNLK